MRFLSLKTIGINTKISSEEQKFLRTNTSWEVHYKRNYTLLFYKEINFPGLKCGGMTWFCGHSQVGQRASPCRLWLLCIRDWWRLHELSHTNTSHVFLSGCWKKDGREQLCKNFWQNKHSSCFCLFSIYLNENTQIKRWLGEISPSVIGQECDCLKIRLDKIVPGQSLGTPN